MNMVFKDGKIYVVTEFGLKQVGYYTPVLHQGSITDCEAYIRLRSSDLLV
jgi:hypothetical protein